MDITEIPREDYVEAERSRVVNELKELNKPFVIVLNNPSSDETRSLCK